MKTKSIIASLLILVLCFSGRESAAQQKRLADDAIRLMMMAAAQKNGVNLKGISIESNLYNVQLLNLYIKKGERSLVFIIPQTTQTEALYAIGFAAGMFKEANANPLMKANLKHLVISIVDDNDTPLHCQILPDVAINEMFDGSPMTPAKADAVFKKWIRVF